MAAAARALVHTHTHTMRSVVLTPPPTHGLRAAPHIWQQCSRCHHHAYTANRSSSRRRSTVSRAAARDQGPFDSTTNRALREAAEVLADAQELARQQTLHDLMSSWTGDAAAAAAADGTATGTPGQQQQQQQQQQRQQQRQELPIQPSPPAALQAFWCEQGLTAAQAQQLLKEVADDPQLAAAAALSNTQVLSDKLASLARVLPGVDIAHVVWRVPQLLAVPSGAAVEVLVALVSALPGCDVVDMVSRQPRLLLLDGAELPARLDAVCGKLVQLHPSHSQHVAAGLISDNPELILRMPYYLSVDVRLLDDLPIEIQNMMVLGGKGLGLLYKYWGERRSSSSSSGASQGQQQTQLEGS